MYHATLRGGQHVQTRLRHEHRRSEICLNALIPLFEGHVLQGYAAHAACVSGIVNQAVEVAGEEDTCLLDGGFDGVGGAKVTGVCGECVGRVGI